MIPARGPQTKFLCSLCNAFFAMQPLQCILCNATFAMQSLQCNLCNATFAMQSLQCNLGNGISAMQSLQCNLCNAIFAMQSLQWRRAHLSTGASREAPVDKRARVQKTLIVNRSFMWTKTRLLQSILATITVLLQSKRTPHKACLKTRGAEILQDLGHYCRSATEEEDASVDNHFRNDRAAVIVRLFPLHCYRAQRT